MRKSKDKYPYGLTDKDLFIKRLLTNVQRLSPGRPT